MPIDLTAPTHHLYSVKPAARLDSFILCAIHWPSPLYNFFGAFFGDVAFLLFQIDFFLRSCCCSQISGWQTVFVFFFSFFFCCWCVRCLTHSLFFWSRSKIVDFLFLCSERAPPSPTLPVVCVSSFTAAVHVRSKAHSSQPNSSGAPRPSPGYCKFYLLPSCVDSTIPKTLYLLTIFMNIRVFL